MPGKLPPGTVQWRTFPTRSNSSTSPSSYSPRAAIVQSVPKDVSAVPRPVRVTRPLGWYTTTPEGVTLVGAGMNVFLAALKLVAGMVAGSASLVADAGHSLSDLVTDAVCMLALRQRNKRAEALCTLSIGSILCATGIGMTSAAGMALISPTRAGAACGAHLAATVRGSQGAALLVAIFSVISCAAPPAHLLACSLSSVSRAASASGTSRHQYRATLRGVCAWGSAEHTFLRPPPLAPYPRPLPCCAALEGVGPSALPPPRTLPRPGRSGSSASPTPWAPARPRPRWWPTPSTTAPTRSPRSRP